MDCVNYIEIESNSYLKQMGLHSQHLKEGSHYEPLNHRSTLFRESIMIHGIPLHITNHPDHQQTRFRGLPYPSLIKNSSQ